METYAKQSKSPARTLSARAGHGQPDMATILQTYRNRTAQLAALTDDDDQALQGKFTTQLQEDDDEALQGKFVAQLQSDDEKEPLQQKAENRTGLPDQLKSGVENLSGYSLDAVKVHYNSPKPAQLQALAYTQGTDIHVGPGQERYLGHEAWHVVQQMQGRVQPTTQLQGVAVNDNEGLEREADVMGEKVLQKKSDRNHIVQMVRTYAIERLGFFSRKPKITHLTRDAQDIDQRKYFKENGVPEVEINNFINNGVIGAKLLALPARIRRGVDFETEVNAGVTPVGGNENLILVSHASMPHGAVLPNFGGYNPTALANRLNVSGLLPNPYTGEIYIDGCNTARDEPGHPNTSYISLFDIALRNLGYTQHRVKGNLGLAATQPDGREAITVNQDNYNDIITRFNNLPPATKGKYIFGGPNVHFIGNSLRVTGKLAKKTL